MIKIINNKKYRINVGIAVMNLDGLFWVGKRSKTTIKNTKVWQLPQGGQDKGETIIQTAKRELYEETGITNIKILKISNWMHYDYPKNIRPFMKQDGQIQKWVLALFTGSENEINLNIDNEFCQYRWDCYQNIIHNAVNFKKNVYKKAFKEFHPFLLSNRKIL